MVQPINRLRPSGLPEARRRRRLEQETPGATVHSLDFLIRQIDIEGAREPEVPLVELITPEPEPLPPPSPRAQRVIDAIEARRDVAAPVAEVPVVAPEELPVIETGAEREFADETQISLLRDILEQGLGGRTIARPLFLAPFQATQFGIELEEGEFLRVEPGPSGEPLIRVISPEGITPAIPLEAGELPVGDDLIQRIYPDVEGLTVSEIVDIANADPDAFLTDLIARGQNVDTESLLQLLGLDNQAIRNVFRFGDIPDEGQPHVFPTEEDGVVVSKQGILTPDGIVTREGIQQGVVDFSNGSFKSIDRIRREMIPSPDAIRRQLRIGQVPEDEIDAIIAQSQLDLTSEEWLEEYKRINPSFRKDFSYSLSGRAVSAGLGDLLQGVGGVAGWAKQETFRDNLMELGSFGLSTAPPMVPYTTLGETISNPQFWQTTAVRTTTLSVVSIVPVILGAYAAAPIIAGVGIGATGTFLLSLLFGSAAGALPEAALESGFAWNEAKRLGFTDDEADKAAGSVYWKNAGLLFGTNAVGFGLPFAKIPGSVIPKMIAKGWVKPIIVGGKLAGTSLTEGGQEFFQDIITRTALGQDVKWDDEAKMAVMLGTVLGGVTGGGLLVFDTIRNRTKAQFTPEQQDVFAEQKKQFTDIGFVDDAAELRAMDFMVAEFDDVKTNLENNVEQVNREEAAKLITTEDRAEALAVDHVIEQGEAAPLTQALVTDAESVVTRAEAIQPDNPQVQEMRRLVDEAKTLTGDAQRRTLIQIEALEDEVKGIAGITEPVVPEVTPEVEIVKLEPAAESLIKAGLKFGRNEAQVRLGAKALSRLDGIELPQAHHVAEALQYLNPDAVTRIETEARADPESVNAQDTLSRLRVFQESVVGKLPQPTPPVEAPVVLEGTERKVGNFEVMTDKDGRTIFCG